MRAQIVDQSSKEFLLPLVIFFAWMRPKLLLLNFKMKLTNTWAYDPLWRVCSANRYQGLIGNPPTWSATWVENVRALTKHSTCSGNQWNRDNGLGPNRFVRVLERDQRFHRKREHRRIHRKRKKVESQSQTRVVKFSIGIDRSYIPQHPPNEKSFILVDNG